MGGSWHIAAEMALADLRLERIVQEGSGPFERTHRVDRPSLVYLPATGGAPALGCFGEARSHRAFTPFGTAVVVPAHTLLRVRSPGFAARDMLILRFEEAAFQALTGLDASASETELSACADVRAAPVLAPLERLAVEMARPATARETIVAGLGLVALGELARHFEASRHRACARRGVLADWQMHRIEARLCEERLPPPPIEELARLCGIGRRHLMRAYKATTGETVMARAERLLFDRALRLLEADERPMKAIAGALGYESPGSFSTAFRRRFGQTPRDWRARRRAERGAVR